MGHGAQGKRFGANAPVIVACQALNGLGLSAHQTWALRRAEAVALYASPFRLAHGASLSMAHVRVLPDTMLGAPRMSWMLDRVLRGYCAWLSGRVAPGRFIAALALPERFHEAGEHPRFAKERGQIAGVARSLLAEIGVEPSLAVHAYGHAAGAYGLLWAGEQIASGAVDLAFVVGVDSSFDADVIDALLDEGLLFDGRQASGLVPGEGCALVVLASADFARQHGLHALATLDSVGIAQEPAHSRRGPSTGQGLASAVRAITETVSRPVDWWLGDLTHEHYRQRELQLAWPRFPQSAMGPSALVEQLPAHLGDLGAATIGTAISIATEGMSRGDPAARSCAAFACSQGTLRGAVLIRREPIGRERSA
ncbi:MAG: hypothetical protein IT378_03070 [Sandaracinaceae bacterium]|nr:hypothetical protein [Sandaracinaceae bacterium]